MNIIELKQIDKKYNEGKDNEVHALCSVDLVVVKGESLAVMGVSGSGKSTLLNILGCLDKATSGCYILNEQNIEQKNAAELAKIRNKTIGFVLQSFGLIEDDTVYTNVKMPLLFSDNFKGKEIKKRVYEVIKQVGLEGLENKKVKDMSGGQCQRVAIARAIVNDPDIILADEPTSALDSKTAGEIMDLFEKLKTLGKTLIIVTHDQKVADKLDRIVHIVDGKILENI